MDKCPSPLKITMIGVNRTKNTAIIFHPDCKKWSCPYCSEKNAATWLHQGIRGASILVMDGHQLRLVTVTSRAHASEVQSLYYFKTNFPRLREKMRYHGGKVGRETLEYFLIPERHRTGVLHFHMITTSPLKQRWFKDNAYKSGFGYMAKSDPLKDAIHATSYITKYLTKSIGFDGWPKGFRRVRVSRGWPMSKEAKKPGWEWSQHNNKSAWFEKHILNDAGFFIIDKRGE